MFKQDDTPGLSTILQGVIPAADAPVPVTNESFRLLPVGAPPSHFSLLTSQHIRQVIADYRPLFDLIIIDTPPVLPVPDALIIGQWTDGAIIATRLNVSRVPLVVSTRNRLASVGIPLLMMVISGGRRRAMVLWA